jgi:hypothetical protein
LGHFFQPFHSPNEFYPKIAHLRALASRNGPVIFGDEIKKTDFQQIALWHNYFYVFFSRQIGFS